MALQYFLKIDGVTGDSTDKNFAGWFTVDGFDIGVTTPTSIGSGSTGAGAGKATFSPLTVDVHSLTGLASLFGDELKGVDLKSVELVAVESTKGKEQTVYDLKLTNAQIGSLENDPSTHGVETALTFDYKSITLKDPTQPGPSTANTFSWNVVTNSQVPVGETQDGALVPAASTTAGGTTGAPSADAAVAVPASSPLHYFLKIDGVTGDSTDKNFAGWFAVDGFDIGVTTPVSVGSSGGGAGAGKSTFAPLTVDVHSLTGLASLLGDELKGVDLKSVELVAVDSTKGKEQTVYDLKLTDAQIGSLENTPGTHGVETALTFDYKSITLKDPTQQGPGTANTFSWNVVTNSEAPVGETQDGALVPAASTTAGGTTGAPSTDAAVAVPASSPLHYFLKIDGVTGDSTDKNFAGWFAVDGFDIGVTTPVSVGSSGGGAGAGKSAFAPLTVDVHSLTGLASLLGDELKGVDLKSVELVAVDSTKGKEQTVYDLKLTDAQIGSFENIPGTHGVETALTFDYKSITLKDPTQQGPGTANTFSWNVVTNSQVPVGETQDGALVPAASTTAGGTTGAPSADAAVAVPASSPLHYFLKIDGVTGDSTDKNFAGWFTVDGFDIGVTTPISIGSGSTGAGAGKATFSPLTVDVHSLSGLASLLGDELKGVDLKSVELVAVDSTKGKEQTVYDLKLTDAQIGSLENTPGTHGVATALTFDYKSITLKDPTQQGPGTANTFSWNVVTNSEAPVGETQDGALVPAASTTTGGTTGAPSADAAVAVPASSPLHYFLKIDGVTGDSTDKNFAGWFTVDGFDIGVTTPTSIGSGSAGAGAGKATFSPLTVDIHSLTGLASLFGDELKGVDLKSVELVAVESTKGKEQTVYDLKLTNAQIGSLENDPGTHGVETALTFDYKSITLKDPTQQGPSTANTFSWDRLTNSQTATGEVTSGALASAASTSVASTSDPVMPVPVPASSPLHYFLKIDGVTGDATDKSHTGWFAVDGYDIEMTTPTSVGSDSTGAGAGKATFSPLTVDVHSLTGLASLFGDEVKGSDIKSVELVGVNNSDQTVYDLKLTNALVASFDNTPGTHGVETALSFDYKGLSLTDHAIMSNGSLGKAETFSFDLTTNTTASMLSSFMAASGASGSLVTPLTHQDNPWLT